MPPRITAQRIADFRVRFDEWSRAPERAGGFTRRAAMADLHVGPRMIDPVLRELLEAGLLVDRGHLYGFVRTDTAAAGVTLAALEELATKSLDTDLKVKTGRPSEDASLDVHSLTPGQVTGIRTVIGLIAEGLVGDRSRRDVLLNAAHLEWDPSGGTGARGAWILTKRGGQLEAWSNARAARKGKGRNSSLASHLADAKTLLDLAATKELITRATAVGTNAPADDYAPAWQPHVDAWTTALEAHVTQTGRIVTSSRRKAMRNACRVLARYATRLGYADPASADWTAVRNAIVRDYESKSDGQGGGRDDRKSFYNNVLSSTRRYYRVLSDLGLITGDPWETMQDRRASLVVSAAIADATRPRSRERSDTRWVDREGTRLASLVHGRYGVANAVNWLTLPGHQLAENGLPPRERPRSTEQDTMRALAARKRGREPYRYTWPALRSVLAMTNMLAGWADSESRRCRSECEETAREERRKPGPALLLPAEGKQPAIPALDFALADDLAALTNPRLVQTWADTITGTDYHELQVQPRSPLVSKTAHFLATIASPFCEAQALAAGDEPLADEFRRRSNTLRMMGVAYHARDKKHLRAIEEAWRLEGHAGWHTLTRLIDEIECHMVVEAGGIPIEEQAAAIREHRFVPSYKWGLLSRAGALLALLRKIPLRARTTSELRLDMWHADGGRAAPWIGAIRLEIPAHAMKGKRDFRPSLLSRSRLGDPVAERGIRRHLLELYLMPRGGREEVLSIYTRDGASRPADRRVVKSEYLFPSAARRGTGGHGVRDHVDREARGCRWDEGALSAHFRALVLEYGPRIGLDVRLLETLYGALGLHVLRLLYGSHWAERNLFMCSKMLHHLNTSITERLYCAKDESDADLDESSPTQGGVSEAPLEVLRRENEELRRQLAQVLTRLAPAEVAA